MSKDELNDSKEIDANVEDHQLEISQYKTIKKEVPEPLDPTRYGDWEKNGRCIDF